MSHIPTKSHASYTLHTSYDHVHASLCKHHNNIQMMIQCASNMHSSNHICISKDFNKVKNISSKVCIKHASYSMHIPYVHAHV